MEFTKFHFSAIRSILLRSEFSLTTTSCATHQISPPLSTPANFTDATLKKQCLIAEFNICDHNIRRIP